MKASTWGWVTAQPHQHLVVIRNGKVVFHAQGGSIFQWPGDAVALVDTRVRRLQFTADQVTREKIGVAVAGLAVFRVVEPLIAFRMLDLGDPEGVASILREMFVGATRRLVANLTLEECMTKRKDALASELMHEVAPVVQGSGRLEDGAQGGWGLALDTIEIQDVRVLSSEVFERLQAPYRQSLALTALQAEAKVHMAKFEEEKGFKRAGEDSRREMMALEESRLKAERERAERAQQHEADLVSKQLKFEMEQAQRKLTSDLEQQKIKLAADLEQHRIKLAAHEESERLKFESGLERSRQQTALNEEIARKALEADLTATEERAAASARAAAHDAEAERIRRQTAAEMTRLERLAMGEVSDARLRELMLTVTMPQVAEAFRGSFDKIVVTGGGDFSVLGQGIAQVWTTLDALGARLPKVDSGRV